MRWYEPLGASVAGDPLEVLHHREGPSVERRVELVHRVVVQHPRDGRLAVRAAEPGEPELIGELLPVDGVGEGRAAGGTRGRRPGVDGAHGKEGYAAPACVHHETNLIIPSDRPDDSLD